MSKSIAKQEVEKLDGKSTINSMYSYQAFLAISALLVLLATHPEINCHTSKYNRQKQALL